MPAMPRVANPYPYKIPAYAWTQAVKRGHEMNELDGVTGGEKLDTDIKMIINLAGGSTVAGSMV